ncbi:hypothetical protein APICC_00542 [Apis cerana cerana]|uniref:Uncharacterized protein n=1 Tax=Apis cerana cerana TaxID=94128 RepID=A0A2A3EAD3_APICC|nr:hypothetical protein APICC_00542 [Apis cerana cerana]
MSLCSNAVLFGPLFTDANALGRLRSMPRAKLRAVKLAEWRLEILGPIGLSTKSEEVGTNTKFGIRNCTVYLLIMKKNWILKFTKTLLESKELNKFRCYKLKASQILISASSLIVDVIHLDSVDFCAVKIRKCYCCIMSYKTRDTSIL